MGKLNKPLPVQLVEIDPLKKYIMFVTVDENLSEYDMEQTGIHTRVALARLGVDDNVKVVILRDATANMEEDAAADE